MRILAVTNLYPNPLDPMRGPFNRQQFRALACRHPMRVIAPISWVDELVSWVTGKGGVPRGRRVTCDGITVDHPRYLYPPRILRGRHGSCYRRSIRPAFERALTEFRPDVVLATWAYPDGWAALDLGHKAGLPVAIKVHGCDVLWGLRNNPGRLPRTKEALSQADGVIAVSQDLADEVVRFGVSPERVRVVYNGVDASLFHPGPRELAREKLGLPSGEKILLFVGALVKVKGLDLLLAACARLRAQGHSFRCCIVGEGPLRAELVRTAKALGIAPFVDLLGPRPHAQLGDWYRAASVFVLPSRSEGVPGVLVEAIACGIPFVATRVGGTPEVAHLGHGRLVPPCDPTALADALAEQLRSHPVPTPSTALRDHDEAAADLARCLTDVVGRSPLSRPTACGATSR